MMNVRFLLSLLLVPMIAHGYILIDEEKEYVGTNSDTFTLDLNNTATGDVSLSFGTLLNASISFDTVLNQFSLTQDLSLNGNQLLDSDGVAGAAGDVLVADGAGKNRWEAVGINERIAYEVYERGTTGTFTTAWTRIDYDTERNTSTFFDLSGGQVKIAKDGYYFATYTAGVDNNTSGSRTNSEAAIFLNGTVVDGSNSFMYHRIAANGENSGTKRVLLKLGAGDVLDVRARRIAGGAAIRTIPLGSNLIIESL